MLKEEESKKLLFNSQRSFTFNMTDAIVKRSEVVKSSLEVFLTDWNTLEDKAARIQAILSEGFDSTTVMQGEATDNKFSYDEGIIKSTGEGLGSVVEEEETTEVVWNHKHNEVNRRKASKLAMRFLNNNSDVENTVAHTIRNIDDALGTRDRPFIDSIFRKNVLKQGEDVFKIRIGLAYAYTSMLGMKNLERKLISISQESPGENWMLEDLANKVEQYAEVVRFALKRLPKGRYFDEVDRHSGFLEVSYKSVSP